jgi:hypothetical protein
VIWKQREGEKKNDITVETSFTTTCRFPGAQGEQK